MEYKNCPFCGGSAALRIKFFAAKEGTDILTEFVQCEVCGASSRHETVKVPTKQVKVFCGKNEDAEVCNLDCEVVNSLTYEEIYDVIDPVARHLWNAWNTRTETKEKEK